MANKKSQGMVIDMIMLVLIMMVFFIFITSKVTNKTVDSGTMRSQSNQIQQLIITVLQYPVQNGTYENATVSEIIGRFHCGDNLDDEINTTIHTAMKDLSKEDYYFIFISEVSNYNKINVYNNVSCVKTENINVARFEMDLPCSKKADISLGIWPASKKVKTC